MRLPSLPPILFFPTLRTFALAASWAIAGAALAVAGGASERPTAAIAGGGLVFGLLIAVVAHYVETGARRRVAAAREADERERAAARQRLVDATTTAVSDVEDRYPWMSLPERPAPYGQYRLPEGSPIELGDTRIPTVTLPAPPANMGLAGAGLEALVVALVTATEDHGAGFGEIRQRLAARGVEVNRPTLALTMRRLTDTGRLVQRHTPYGRYRHPDHAGGEP